MIKNPKGAITIEHAELIDMRTHLTVAMLAAAQLQRRTRQLPEAAHLQCYLDQSLQSLVEDISRVDMLVARDAAPNPATTRAPRLWHRVMMWLLALPGRGVHAFGRWIHRRRCARATTLYFSR